MIRFTLCILLLLLCLKTHAHEFLTELLVNSDVEIKPSSIHINTFNLTKSDLHAALARDIIKQEIKLIATSNDPEINPEIVICDDWDEIFKTCGVFDHFNEARSIAIDTCDSMTANNSQQYNNVLIPEFLGPNTFINNGSAGVDHHENYSFNQGLSFNCIEVIPLWLQDE